MLIWMGSLGKNLSQCTIMIFVLFSVLYVNMYKVKKKGLIFLTSLVPTGLLHLRKIATHSSCSGKKQRSLDQLTSFLVCTTFSPLQTFWLHHLCHPLTGLASLAWTTHWSLQLPPFFPAVCSPHGSHSNSFKTHSSSPYLFAAKPSGPKPF